MERKYISTYEKKKNEVWKIANSKWTDIESGTSSDEEGELE